MQVYLYLNAVNKIFERCLLSQYPVYDVNSPNMKLILEGFKYFVDWYQEIATSTDSNDKQSFLSWQTWDLLQVLISGMKPLIADFTARHPDYFVVLSRINGSVVESLFSQLKYSVSGTLSSINYGNVRAAVLVKSNCHTHNSSNAEYRDNVLHVNGESDV